MPKDPSIKKVLVIGSGPIIIGQAAEFDYSGTQACRALKEEGIQVVLVNPNPATIMTDEGVADRVYLEPLDPATLEAVIEQECPQGLIATMGGQAGLNLGIELHQRGTLERLGVRLLGTDAYSIKKGEDRELFKQTMISLGQPVPRSTVVNREDDLQRVLREVGLPCVIRPAFTLGGTGGGYARTVEELRQCLQRGISASPIHEVLVESSLYGQKEIEFEVVRDGYGNCIAVCSMENLDPIGIHTGDSVVVAPALTLADSEYQKLRQAAIDIACGLDIKGACNVQFALDPNSGDYAVIEVNPRVSRSSALASKATGYPIARVAAKIALGLALDEVLNEVTGRTYACHEPALDYVAIKVPRWPWDKFTGGNRNLGLQMKSTGEVMAIGRTFEEALGKAISSLEDRKSAREYWGRSSRETIMEKLSNPDHTRLFWVFRALYNDVPSGEISAATGIDIFFVERIANMVRAERALAESGLSCENLSSDLLLQCKTLGISDARIAEILHTTEDRARAVRESHGIRPLFAIVDTCAGEFEATTPYYYSSYEKPPTAPAPRTLLNVYPPRPRPESGGKPSVVVLGGGPIRIGQGIEFDYCAVHAAWALKEEGYDSVIINNNPETVSTDFNTATRLYFEPLTFEHVKNVLDIEKPVGVLVGFGGQTAINLAEPLHKHGIRILGTPPEAIDITEDRGKFSSLLRDLGIPAIEGCAVTTRDEARRAAEAIGYPVIVRPSYVIGGRAMAIVYGPEELEEYLDEAVQASEGHPILVDKYILAREVEVDVVSDGIRSYVPAILEHVERSGIHSGDSIAQIPAVGLSGQARSKILKYTDDLCRALGIKGIANIQYIVDGDEVFCLEVNPRASRTVPFVTKVTGFPLIKVATGLALGKTIESYGLTCSYGPEPEFFAVKMPVFSWSKIMVDPIVGPEMKSTGEAMGAGKTLEEAMLKGFLASGVKAHRKAALLTAADRDKPQVFEAAKILSALGWTLYSTKGTAAYFKSHGLEPQTVLKVSETDSEGIFPTISEIIKDRLVDFVVNTFTRGGREESDGFKIRSMAVQRGIPVVTCADTGLALAKALSSSAEIAVRDLTELRSSGYRAACR